MVPDPPPTNAIRTSELFPHFSKVCSLVSNPTTAWKSRTITGTVSETFALHKDHFCNFGLHKVHFCVGPTLVLMMVCEFHSLVCKETRKLAMEIWGGKRDVLVSLLVVNQTPWVCLMNLLKRNKSDSLEFNEFAS
ncbi:hypothetical protein LXL04_037455 [Taraxacum kok-saghyz]